MTWFRLDDNFHSHRKVTKAGDAIALWACAASWASQQLTDGWVPDYVIRNWSEHPESHAKRLEQVGLWEAGTHEGESGWWFHDWLDRNPSRQQVEATRDATRERQKKWREASPSRVTDAVTDTVSNAVTDTVTNTAPSLPVPSLVLPSEELQNQETKTPPAAPSARGFDEFWSVYPRREARKAALTAYKRALRSSQHAEILAGARRYRDDPNRVPSFTAHASTWLNQGRWADDPLPVRGSPAPPRPSRSDAAVAAVLAIPNPYEQQQEIR